MRHFPSIETIRATFDYDPVTGAIRWKVRPAYCIQVGDTAGAIDRQGYLRIQFKGRQYQGHHIAWAHHFGEPPPDRLDHRNLHKADNRIENLRPATPSQNNGNHPAKVGTSSKLKGVCWNKQCRRWQAQIKVRGKSIYLGLFEDEMKAHEAYVASAKLHFGEYARAA